MLNQGSLKLDPTDTVVLYLLNLFPRCIITPDHVMMCRQFTVKFGSIRRVHANQCDAAEMIENIFVFQFWDQNGSCIRVKG